MDREAEEPDVVVHAEWDGLIYWCGEIVMPGDHSGNLWSDVTCRRCQYWHTAPAWSPLNVGYRERFWAQAEDDVRAHYAVLALAGLLKRATPRY